MATIQLLLADGTTKYFKVTGSGTAGDPYMTTNTIEAGTVSVDNTVTVDALPAGANMIGGVKDAGFYKTVTTTYTTTTTTANTAFDITPIPATGEKVVLVDLLISVNTNCLLLLKDNNATPATYLGTYMTASSGVDAIIPRAHIKCATANKKFQLVTSTSSVTVQVTANWYSEA